MDGLSGRHPQLLIDVYKRQDMYEDVPAVVFQSGMVCTAGGYESAMLYDIYLA